MPFQRFNPRAVRVEEQQETVAGGRLGISLTHSQRSTGQCIRVRRDKVGCLSTIIDTSAFTAIFEAS